MKFGLLGYGKLGEAVEQALLRDERNQLVGIFTNRPTESVKAIGAEVISAEKIKNYEGEIDCVIVCHGSAEAVPKEVPILAKYFNTVDCFDNHKEMKTYIEAVDKASRLNKKTAVVGAGWDPGLFSWARLLFAGLMPYAGVNTFWGPGISQGHSQALRCLEGVYDAVQITTPMEEKVKKAEGGEILTNQTSTHKRICYIACDKSKEDDIRNAVLCMDNYFKGYETELIFTEVERVEMLRKKCGHKGRVLAVGSCEGSAAVQRAELLLDLESNPEYTAGIILSGAKACVRMGNDGIHGAYTFLDIQAKYLCPEEIDYMSFL